MRIIAELTDLIKPEDLLADNLTDVFVSLGTAALKSEDTICLFIDEMQYLKKAELEALANAIHRVNQKRLPLMIFAAGLPKVFKELGDAKSYSERLFLFEAVDALNRKDAELAITEPARQQKVVFEKEAVDAVISVTQGIPILFRNIVKLSGRKWEMQKSLQKRWWCSVPENYINP